MVDIITLTSLCNLDPFAPHFYAVKLGFSGEYIISVFYGFLVFLNAVLFCLLFILAFRLQNSVVTDKCTKCSSVLLFYIAGIIDILHRPVTLMWSPFATCGLVPFIS